MSCGLPRSNASNRVITFVVLAGGRAVWASLSYSIAPEAPSITTAAFASIGGGALSLTRWGGGGPAGVGTGVGGVVGVTVAAGKEVAGAFGSGVVDGDGAAPG